MSVIYLILLILGFVCFLLSAAERPLNAHVNLLALGLMFWILVPLITLARSM
jgi:hypothetical protein